MDYYRIKGLDVKGSSLYVCKENDNYFMFIERVILVEKASKQGIPYTDVESVDRSSFKKIDQVLFYAFRGLNDEN